MSGPKPPGLAEYRLFPFGLFFEVRPGQWRRAAPSRRPPEQIRWHRAPSDDKTALVNALPPLPGPLPPPVPDPRARDHGIIDAFTKARIRRWTGKAYQGAGRPVRVPFKGRRRLRRLRCGTNRTTTIVKAVFVLHTHQREAAKSSRTPPTRLHHRPLDTATHRIPKRISQATPSPGRSAAGPRSGALPLLSSAPLMLPPPCPCHRPDSHSR